ncbi:DUF6082 family protein [Streptomyces rubradiris]|uniref:Secreted protein n=1 Tax=Streptomyces rubradiris TaxID=285531 RepID=A0ABQ3RDG6_STRRR|nr:DUF6082 family protein [Streptomyces rubradiris]GHG95383.1 hypothetical protein GCM10018792_06130 [Streptomyces rubradiris]GHI53876.1 hypothetical protein Srubr_37220 [Streptomyces rubradiris]
MKIPTPAAVLIASAVGAVGIWRLEQHSQRRNALHAAQMHQELIAEVAANPEIQEVWMPPGGERSEYTLLLHVNRLVSFLSVKFRVGLLNEESLGVQAKAAMEREAVRRYWETYGGFREEEAMDSTDARFNEIMSAAYDKAVRPSRRPQAEAAA